MDRLDKLARDADTDLAKNCKVVLCDLIQQVQRRESTQRQCGTEAGAATAAHLSKARAHLSNIERMSPERLAQYRILLPTVISKLHEVVKQGTEGGERGALELSLFAGAVAKLLGTAPSMDSAVATLLFIIRACSSLLATGEGGQMVAGLGAIDNGPIGIAVKITELLCADSTDAAVRQRILQALGLPGTGLNRETVLCALQFCMASPDSAGQMFVVLAEDVVPDIVRDTSRAACNIMGSMEQLATKLPTSAKGGPGPSRAQQRLATVMNALPEVYVRLQERKGKEEWVASALRAIHTLAQQLHISHLLAPLKRGLEVKEDIKDLHSCMDQQFDSLGAKLDELKASREEVHKLQQQLWEAEQRAQEEKLQRQQAEQRAQQTEQKMNGMAYAYKSIAQANEAIVASLTTGASALCQVSAAPTADAGPGIAFPSIPHPGITQASVAVQAAVAHDSSATPAAGGPAPPPPPPPLPPPAKQQATQQQATQQAPPPPPLPPKKMTKWEQEEAAKQAVHAVLSNAAAEGGKAFQARMAAKRAAEQAAAEQAAAEKAAAEQAAADKAAAEKASAEQAAAKKAAAEKAAAEAAAAQPAAAQPAAAQPAAAQPAAAEPAAAEKATAEQASAEPAPAEQAAAEKATAELASAENAPPNAVPTRSSSPTADGPACRTPRGKLSKFSISSNPMFME